MPQIATSCAFFETLERVAGLLRQFADLVHPRIQRMAGDVEPEHFLFIGEFLDACPVRQIRKRGFG